tara:strand:+ start:12771 stop:13331 length:561 start_codon:yes stop_codon:yes gene_type:complete
MDISGIISISGRPGLYKVVAQGKNSIIVESLTDKKRFPAYSTDRISALEDISIYTLEEDKPLKDIYTDILAKIGNTNAPSHKEDITTLQEFLVDILPNYDDERVYPSDIKKLFQWYNLLFKVGIIKVEKEAPKKADETTKVKEKVETKKTPAKKATPAKKGATKKTTKAKPTASAKKPVAKKVQAK